MKCNTFKKQLSAVLSLILALLISCSDKKEPTFQVGNVSGRTYVLNRALLLPAGKYSLPYTEINLDGTYKIDTISFSVSKNKTITANTEGIVGNGKLVLIEK